jgi:hypothetical protein
VFYFFLKTDIGSIAFVNATAKSIFAVYIVHQVPAFQSFEWHTIFRSDSLQGLAPSTYAASILWRTVCLVAAVTVIDLLRKRLFTLCEALKPMPAEALSARTAANSNKDNFFINKIDVY